jgi:formate--tetrahydrofolate ligase
MQKICRNIYGADDVKLTNIASRQLLKYEKMGYGRFPVCMAKTQKSLSDDEKKLGGPENFDIHIREFEIATGAGFIIPIAGNMLRMPGLPATPAAEGISIDTDGNVHGLF